VSLVAGEKPAADNTQRPVQVHRTGDLKLSVVSCPRGAAEGAVSNALEEESVAPFAARIRWRMSTMRSW